MTFGMKDVVVIALGSNLGDAKAHIHEAYAALGAFIDNLRLSPLYESQPMYYSDQPNFVNAVAAGVCDMAPIELLLRLKTLEKDIGRTEGFRNGPRVIDLDIVLYGMQIVDEPELVIPHPRMTERPFVMVPLADVMPDMVHPVMGLRADVIAGLLEYTDEVLREVA